MFRKDVANMFVFAALKICLFPIVTLKRWLIYSKY